MTLKKHIVTCLSNTELLKHFYEMLVCVCVYISIYLGNKVVAKSHINDLFSMFDDLNKIKLISLNIIVQTRLASLSASSGMTTLPAYVVGIGLRKLSNSATSAFKVFYSILGSS